MIKPSTINRNVKQIGERIQICCLKCLWATNLLVVPFFVGCRQEGERDTKVGSEPQSVAASPNVDVVKNSEVPVREPLATPIMAVVNFPGDYLGKTFDRQLWIASDKIKRGSDGTWRMLTQDGAVSNRDSAPDLGRFYLDNSKLNFLLTADQAKQISGFPAEKVHKCNVTFTIDKRRIEGSDYFVTVFSKIYRLSK